MVDTGDQTILVTEIPSPDGVAIQSFETGGVNVATFNVCNDSADILLGSGDQVEVIGDSGVGVFALGLQFLFQGDEDLSGKDSADSSAINGKDAE